jgi:hypothetical protein
MSNTFIDNRDAWMRLSDVDYLGQFVKSWLALNAWYRSAYTETRDRKIIDEIKWNSNPVASYLRPLLSQQSDEAEQFRAEIGLLHHRLENYEIITGKGNTKERITLTNIFLKENPPCVKSGQSHGCLFSVERIQNKEITVKVLGKTGNPIYQLTQPHYNLTGLQDDPAYGKLSTSRQSYLRALYDTAAPRLIADLTNGNEASIQCGAHTFGCSREHLFAGLVEAVYLMRCTLFHGELSPTREAAACYEPAYRIVRRFLECIN